MSQPKEIEGLGLKDCLAHLMVLLKKWVAKVIDGPHTKWSMIFREISRKFAWEKIRILNQACYNNIERLMFDTIKSNGAMTYTRGFWKSWISLLRHLTIFPIRQSSPSTLKDVKSHQLSSPLC